MQILVVDIEKFKGGGSRFYTAMYVDNEDQAKKRAPRDRLNVVFVPTQKVLYTNPPPPAPPPPRIVFTALYRT